jgi:ribosomal protein L37AE/L43A
MGSDEDRLERYLAETCPECRTPGPQRHLSAVGGCRTCAENDPRPVYTPQRLEPTGWRVKR